MWSRQLNQNLPCPTISMGVQPANLLTCWGDLLLGLRMQSTTLQIAVNNYYNIYIWHFAAGFCGSPHFILLFAEPRHRGEAGVKQGAGAAETLRKKWWKFAELERWMTEGDEFEYLKLMGRIVRNKRSAHLCFWVVLFDLFQPILKLLILQIKGASESWFENDFMENSRKEN